MGDWVVVYATVTPCTIVQKEPEPLRFGLLFMLRRQGSNSLGIFKQNPGGFGL